MSEHSNTQYRLNEPLDRPTRALSAQEVTSLILEGRVFGTDWVQATGGQPTQVQALPEFQGALSRAIGHEVQGAWCGQLHPVQVAELFGYVFNNKLNGYLIARTSENIQKSVAFRAGFPINAYSNIPGEDFKSSMVTKGLLTEEQYNQTILNQVTVGSDVATAAQNAGADPNEIKKQMTVLAISRIVGLFTLKSGSWNFVISNEVNTPELLTQVDVKGLAQTGLAAALDVNESTACLAPFSDQAFYCDAAVSQGFATDQIDQKAFELFAQGMTLRQMIPQFEQGLPVQPHEARARLVVLQKMGIIKPGQAPAGGSVERQPSAAVTISSNTPVLDELKAALKALEAKSYFDLLEVRRVARPEEIDAALSAKLTAHKTETQAGDDQLVVEQRGRIKEFLEKVAFTLKDEDERDLYERALKLGQSLDDPEVRARLRFDQLEAKGRSFLAQQRFEDAWKAFEQAAELQPNLPEIHLSVGWAFFLDSDQDEDDAEKAMESVNRALELAPELDKAYLTAGKIYRLADDKTKAERFLRKASALNPHNNEAQSELRLLFSREITKTKVKSKKKKKKKASSAPSKSKSKREQAPADDFDDGVDVPLGALLGVSGVLLIALFACGNFIPGGLDRWPDIQAEKTESQVHNEAEREFLHQAQARFEKSEEDLQIPKEKQVIGNSEYYFYVDDAWWWSRRVALLFLGLLGIFLINKDSIFSIKWLGSNPTYILYALPYGLIAGFASGVPEIATPLGALLGMTLFHVLAEQIFFLVFLGRGLLKSLRHDPKLALSMLVLLYGVYQFTFFATINQDVLAMGVGVAQVALFAGGAYGFFLFKSGGVIAPFMAHLLIMLVMMIRVGL